MADPVPAPQQNTTAPPAGVTFGAPVQQDTPASSIPNPNGGGNTPPAGVTFGSPVEKDTPAEQITPPPQGALGTILRRSGLEGAGKMLSGFGGEIFETAQGAKNLVNKVLPDSMQIPDIPKEYRENNDILEKAGGLAENAAEWMGGEEGLKALGELASASKYMKNGAMWAHFLQNSPNAAKVVTALGRIAKSGTVGAVQGGVKGAAEGDAAGGAEGGAIGGVLGGAVGETATSLVPKIAHAFGVDRPAVEEMMKVAKPGKWDTDFTKNFLSVADRLNVESKVTPWKSLEDVADGALNQRNELWNTEIKPAIDKHKSNFLNATSIADDLRAKATNPTMQNFSPEGVQEIEKMADTFDRLGGISVGDIEDTLEHLNAKLTNEGWWKKNAAERVAAGKVGDPLAVMDDAARLIREKLYDHLENAGEPEIRNLKKQYGALSSIEHDLRGQVNVQGRKVPLSLKDMVALVAAAASGPKGWLIGAIPVIDRYINSPAAMATRAVRSAVGEEPVYIRAGKAVAPAVEPAAAFAGSQTGQDIEVPTP
jgi:hypothetical protein